MKKNAERSKVKGFQVVENECIWMKAGVVNFHLCDNVYDCQTCPFDKGLQRTLKAEREQAKKNGGSSWSNHLKQQYKGSSRPCRHSLTGRIDAPKICTMSYECHRCPFDQMLDELDLAQSGSSPKYRMASGFRLADGYYYHMGHTWVRFEHGGRVKVGFDHFLVNLFGTMSHLSLPPLGAGLKKDQLSLIFGTNGKKAAVLSPITGTVLAVNHKVREHPEIIHEDPYHSGWLYILEPAMPKRNLKGLYYGKKSIQWIDQETQTLLELMGPEYKDLAATGGQAINNICETFPQIGWEVLVQTFLKTENL